MPRAKPSADPTPRTRNHAREAAGRATRHRVEVALTDDERADVDRLVTALGAPIKQSLLAAVRASLALLNGEGAPAARKLLQADLEPLRPGPKVGA